MKRPFPVSGVSAVLLLTACGGQSRQRPQMSVPVEVATAEAAAAPFVVVADGAVEPLQSVQVEAQVGGVLLSVDFSEGQDVVKGQPLFHIDPRPYQAALRQSEAVLARDEAQAVNSRRDADRYAKLADQDYVTRAQADQAEATARAQAAGLKADSAAVETARLNLSYTVVPAPISGRTGSLLVRAGNLVKTNGSPLVVINQIHPILVRFSIPERVLPQVQHYGGLGELSVSVRPAEANGDSLGTATGVLTFIDNAVDPSTGTVLLKARFDNQDGALWPGEFVRASLQVYVQQDAIQIPQSAPVTEQEGSFVFVVGDDGKAHRQQVELGRTVGDHVIVDSGLTAGDRVVTDGQSRLNEGSTVDVKGGRPVPAADTTGAADAGRAAGDNGGDA